jgi:hypothetical protein
VTFPSKTIKWKGHTPTKKSKLKLRKFHKKLNKMEQKRNKMRKKGTKKEQKGEKNQIDKKIFFSKFWNSASVLKIFINPTITRTCKD